MLQTPPKNHTNCCIICTNICHILYFRPNIQVSSLNWYPVGFRLKILRTLYNRLCLRCYDSVWVTSIGLLWLIVSTLLDNLWKSILFWSHAHVFVFPLCLIIFVGILLSRHIPALYAQYSQQPTPKRQSG